MISPTLEHAFSVLGRIAVMHSGVLTTLRATADLARTAVVGLIMATHLRIIPASRPAIAACEANRQVRRRGGGIS